MTKAPVEQTPVPEGYVLQKQKKPIFKRIWFWLLIAVVVIVIVATQAGGGSTSATGSSTDNGSASGDSASAGIGTAVRDGKFEFTVSGVDCSQNTLGADPLVTKAQGVFCVVSLSVSNVGDEAQLFDASSQKAFDAQNREFSADSGAAMYLGDAANSFLEQLNPGSSVQGKLVYDVPAGTKLTQIELHDSPFSGGAKVSLG